MDPTLLIVEDDAGLRRPLADFFRRHRWKVLEAGAGSEAMESFRKEKVHAVLLDLVLPDTSGLELLRHFRAADEDLIVVVITAVRDVKTAVEAMKAGAYDYVQKPFELEEIKGIMERARNLHGLRSQIRSLRFQRAQWYSPRKVIGESAPMRALRDLVTRAAAAPDTPVLIQGETGTGKEIAAEAIHQLSSRCEASLIKVNCGAIPRHLAESELFGHEPGAFTDAKGGKVGVFSLADGGTIFLDEVGELAADVQPKLLRVLDRQPFRRVGGTREVNVDVRVIAATNRDLGARVEKREFREDLYHRLKVLTLELPPLRDRGKDILLLADEFARQSCAELKRSAKTLSDEMKHSLLGYPWPGNVRELKNVIERAVILCDGETILPEHLPDNIRTTTVGATPRRQPPGENGLSLKDMERDHLRYVMQLTDWNRSEAARRLGISRNALKEKLRRYKLEPDHAAPAPNCPERPVVS